MRTNFVISVEGGVEAVFGRSKARWEMVGQFLEGIQDFQR